MISCEERGEQYYIQFEGDTEELLAGTCSIMAAMCSEMDVEPTDMLYAIAMNFIPAYPGGKENLLTLARWLKEGAEELRDIEGIPS